MTFALFSPKPTGVSSGPFNATRVRVIESIVSGGTPDGSPFLKTSAPASASSQSIGAPVASTMRRAASTHSGPMPSPGISVTRVLSVAAVTIRLLPCADAPCYSRPSGRTSPQISGALIGSRAVTPRRRSVLLSASLFAIVAAACTGGGSSTAVTASGSSGTASPSSGSSTGSAQPALQGFENIQHLIFIVQENRSFDQYFGTFPGADGIPTNAKGDFTVCVPDPKSSAPARSRTTTARWSTTAGRTRSRTRTSTSTAARWTGSSGPP